MKGLVIIQPKGRKHHEWFMATVRKLRNTDVTNNNEKEKEEARRIDKPHEQEKA